MRMNRVDVPLLRRVLVGGGSVCDIADLAGVSLREADGLCRRYGLTTSAEQDERDCLGCERPFSSQHKLNRVCDGCKEEPAWRFLPCFGRAR